MNPKLMHILEDLKNYLQVVYGARLSKLILYGSQARGEAVSGSDIDIMVVLKTLLDSSLEVRRTGEKVADLSLENDEVISCLFMDEERFQKENSPLLLNVRREGILL